MTTRHYACVLAILLLVCGVSAEAQSVFALPASNGLTSTAAAFTAIPLAPAGTFLATPSASIALQAPVGNKYYVISNSGTNTVIAVDNLFSTPRPLASLGQAATAAIITPDGRRVLVVAGNLYGFDTSSDTQLYPNGISFNGGAIDVASTLDGGRILVLSTTGGSSTLSAVDPGTGANLGNLNLPTFTTALSVAPNGLAYVSAQSAVYEVDPRAMTIRTQIQVNGRPGRLTYTADGKTGLAVNQTPFSGVGIYVFDLINRSVNSNILLSSFGNISSLDKIFPVSNTRVLALSSQNQTLYDITLNPQVVNVFSATGVGGSATATISNDLAAPIHSITQFLYYTSGTTLYRFDLSTNTASGLVTLPSAEGALAFVTGANFGSPAAILTYGDNQAPVPSASTTPLVVRVIDSQGRPLANVPVTFSTTASGAILQTASASTTFDGYAVTSLTAPPTAGAVAVSALAGGINASFTVNVGGAPAGGGGGGTGGLTIFAGQGQLFPDQTLTSFFGSPLVVQLKDAAGNPVPSSPITFTVTQGVGGLFGGSPVTVFTDSNGKASVDYQSGLASLTPGFSTGIVTAAASTGSTVTFYETTVSNTTGATVQLAKPISGTVLQGQAGTTLTGAVQGVVASNGGAGIPFVSLHLTNSQDPTMTPAATCSPTPLSDNNGIISCDVLFGGKIGTFQVTPDVGSADFKSFPPITVQITPGPPGAVTIVQGNNQTGTPGTRLPVALVIQVTDAFGNILTGVPVTWRAATSGVTISNIVAITDFNGRASVSATLGNTAGIQQVTATVGSITQTFTLTVVIPVAGIQLVSGNSQTAVVSTAFGAPLVVKVVNASGSPVPGATVTFAINGSASVNPTSTTTDANGIASTAVQAGANPGPITITATSSGFSVVFSLSSRLAGPTGVSFVNGASFQPGISPGAIATITGTGIAPSVVGIVTATTLVGPLQTSLAGVSVAFNGVNAPIYSVSNINGREQVTIQVPFEVAPGNATVVISAGGGGSATINNVTIQSISPGVFQLPGAGNFAVLVRPDGSFVSQDNPIRRGEVIRMYVTGLGQVGPTPLSTNRVGVANQDVLASIVVGINNQGVNFVSAKTLTGVVGVYEVAFLVPSDTVTGPSQPLGLIVTDSAGNTFTAQGTFAPIQ